MISLVCENCGGKEWLNKDGYRICQYCGSSYQLLPEEKVKSSSIALNDDVERLLKKCRENPAQARKYANLVLDIDPTNKEAMFFLYRK